LAHLCERTGCGLLLDINNIIVQAHNNDLNPQHYLETLCGCDIGEMHLSGHISRDFGGESLLIDSHSRPVSDAVWELFDQALHRFGPVPTLIEWDKDLPSLDVLMLEASKANDYLSYASAPERRVALG